jgi:type II secretory pathway pseudopilin PulG
MRKGDRRMLLYTGVLTVVLYVMGIFTGFFVYSMGAARNAEDVSALRGQIEAYSRSLESLQLQQLYLTSQSNLSCRFLVSSLSRLQTDLYGFRQKLPEKLEVYEKYNTQDPAYAALKKEYMSLLLKSWLFSIEVKERCGENVVPVLYFYSAGCDECIEQGYVLDRVRAAMNVTVFTVDLNLDDPTVGMVREVYGITGTPALVINENVYQGLQSYEDVVRAAEGRYAGG